MSRRLGERVTLELVAYRPTRRAVLRATGQSGRVQYIKVVRPGALADLVGRHRMLTAAGVPAPAVVAEEATGMAVLTEGQGESLARVLHRGPGPLTDSVLFALTRTLDMLPASAMQLARRSAWSERSTHYAHAAATVLPEASARTQALAVGVEQLLTAGPPQPVVPVHGDFYEANVLMDPREGIANVSSLLDVDSLGPGYRSDDLACLLGHVSVLVHLAPDRYPAVPHVLARWTQLCEQMVDPVLARPRAPVRLRDRDRPLRRPAAGRLTADLPPRPDGGRMRAVSSGPSRVLTSSDEPGSRCRATMRPAGAPGSGPCACEGAGSPSGA
jgi:hypothetical protein